MCKHERELVHLSSLNVSRSNFCEGSCVVKILVMNYIPSPDLSLILLILIIFITFYLLSCNYK